jgi:hypothetical protein
MLKRLPYDHPERIDTIYRNITDLNPSYKRPM